MSGNSSSILLNPQNKKLSLNLYRSLLRKCHHIDNNPKYKAYFVTPPSLRYQLPTFFLPSVSFTQNLKALFRLYAKFDYPSQNELNHCISDGYFVLRNLNLAYHKKQFDKEDQSWKSIIQDLEKKPATATTTSTTTSSSPSASEASSSSSSSDSFELNDIFASLKETAELQEKNKDSNTNNRVKFNSNVVRNINLNNIDNNVNDKPIDNNQQKENDKDNKDNDKLAVAEQTATLTSLSPSIPIIPQVPLVNLNSDPNFWVIESKEVKPGTLLVSHPSLDMHFKKSVVLITHQVNDHHYGYIINQPLPTSSVIGVLQDQFDNAPQLKNHQYSKNLVQHFRFSAKRPLSPFTKTPWYCGGPSSIEHSANIVKGLDGLPMTQIIHPFSTLPGATIVRDGLYIGGSNFKDVGDKIKSKEISHESVMMMVGCSLWKPGELRKLIDQGAWFPADCTNEQIFKLGKDEKFWSEALQSMGGDYRDLINN